MKFILSLLVISITCTSHSQSLDNWGVRISNNITGKPVLTYHQLFYTNFHPGLEAQYNWSINKNVKHQFFASANVGFYYHRFMHTGIKLYPELEYSYKVKSKWDIGISLGGGYLHSVENVATLEYNETEGRYEKVNTLKGRPQFMFGFDLGAKYFPEIFNGIALTMSFSSFMQGPFVSGYVPLLPYNSFNIGVNVPVKPKTN